jgi:hypothetical protein
MRRKGLKVLLINGCGLGETRADGRDRPNAGAVPHALLGLSCSPPVNVMAITKKVQGPVMQ